MTPPQLVILAGANGSGKSTSAVAVLPTGIAFLNADEIAKTLKTSTASNHDIQAGRIFLREWSRLAATHSDFAIETTLASRTLAPRIAALRAAGYQVHIVFFWLANEELAVARVAERVRRGGHDIPEATIRRRYKAGLRNIFSLYLPLTDTWRVFDNTQVARTRLVAAGAGTEVIQIKDIDVWNEINEATSDEPDRDKR